MDRLTGSQLAHLRAGYLSIVFQDLRLFPELTLWENLELKRRLMGTVSPERSEEMLRRLGIYHKKEALAGTLSYGEQQRAAIVRALLQPFDWLLMDEPFSHLDHENTQRAIHLIREVVEVNRAGFILVDLEGISHFLYHKKCYL